MDIPKTEVLITVDGAERGRLVVEPGEFVIGRDPQCPIRIEAPLVSRNHAKLTLNFDNAFIEDLGSSNGTQVNGKPITGNTQLWPNQKIQVGIATIEMRRLKTEPSPDVTLAPTQEVMKRMLPEESLREKKYDIGGVVAKGGMGAILDAREAAIERKVAMKVMLDGNNPGNLARFIAEAKVTGQLEHPNIVPVHELNVDENGHPFYTMKMVRGTTFKKVLELLAEGDEAAVKKYPLPALLTVFQKVCDALAFAHSKGVIHRDLKPENIMLGDYGEVLLMDWGLAKVLGKSDAPAPGDAMQSLVHARRPGGTGSDTLAGSVMGTPSFMSPEQARGEVDSLDARSDIYSLGAILYQILTLRLPVEGKDAWEVVGKVGRGEIEPLECGSPLPLSANGGKDGKKRQRTGALQKSRPIPDSLAAVVRKAMALDKAQRYATVAEFQRDIEAYQNGFATSAEHAGFVKQTALLIKRHKGIFATGFVAWAIITALLAWFVINVNHERKVAVSERNRAEGTLRELRGTAPTFHEQALALIENQQFADALVKVRYALDLAPDEAGYNFLEGNILESLGRLAEARDAYDEALRLDPAHAFARENRDVCVQLLREEGGRAELSTASLAKLNLLMRKQGRNAEAIATLRETSKDRKALMDTWLAVLAKAGITMNVSQLKTNSILGDDGLFTLNLGGRKIGGRPLDDISFLRGMPLKILDCYGTNISDLTPLEGAPLEVLHLWKNPVSDLSPLRGMKLTRVTLSETKVTDLSPLKGMPLENLNLDFCPVADLSALKGMKLRRLNLNATRVSDLRPLAGMQLELLWMSGTKVADLSPLRGAPLRDVILDGCGVKDLSPLSDAPLVSLTMIFTKVTDLTPLANSSMLKKLVLSGLKACDLAPLAKLQLTELFCPDKVPDLAPLRGHPLRKIGLNGSPGLDVSLLAELPTLEEIRLPDEAKNVELLRTLPRLRFISTRWGIERPAQTAEEFWKEYDAQKPEREKSAAEQARFESERSRLEKELKQAGITPTGIERLPDNSIRLRLEDPAIEKIPQLNWKGISSLTLYNTKVSDLTPLHGLKLEALFLTNTPVTSLEPLRGIPLVKIYFTRTPVTDISPLLECPTLEQIELPPGVKNIELLKKLPNLRRIDYTKGGPPDYLPDSTAEEFWQKYDAQRAAPK